MMKQHGGEGKMSYSGKKGHSPAKQHGGEGKSIAIKGNGMSKGMQGAGYCGPGRYLGETGY